MTTAQVRPEAGAGSFYPADKNELKNLLTSFWPAKPRPVTGIRAIISPHAGYIYSGTVAASAYAKLEPDFYSQIILLGPSHYFLFAGLAADNHLYWQTPLGKIKLKKIPSRPAIIFNQPQYHQPEHSLEVQLPFLQYQLKNPFQILPFLISSKKSLKQITEFISQIMDNKTLLIISSDLSHYYPENIANAKDKFTIESILNLDLDTFINNPKIEACGRWAIAVLVALAQKQGWHPQLVNYSTSAVASGDYSNVVSYASIIFQK